uniref:Protein HGH1 homolog n=1 Tax=Elaeophora elaphi TaxID=1147741 RepID=A0A0R3RYF5_9BILA
MKQHEISPEVIAELIQFLSPNIHHSLRQQALDCVIGLSSSDQFNAIFQAKDFLLGQSLCQLICEDIIDGSDVLPALINVTATDVICAKYVISNTELIKRCIEYCRSNNERRLPERLNEPVSDESANYLGYVLVNLTSIAKVRCLLCEKFVQQMLPLVDCNKTPERYLIAIDILRNMCFESSESCREFLFLLVYFKTDSS